MRVLHTSDWHVGKVLKGRSRADEHAAVLEELVAIAHRHDADTIVVAGDVFDTAAPAPASQALVMRTLLTLREDDRDVIVLAGNHDDPHLFDVYRPVLGALGMHVTGSFSGDAVTFTARSGEPVVAAVVPFLPHRFAVRAAQALTGNPPQHNIAYAEMVARLIARLAAAFEKDAVNLVATHGTVRGGRLGGGEREAQTVLSYYLEPSGFPPAADYGALGHLHLRQRVPGPCPLWYPGPPLAVDFSDETISPGVLIADLEPGAEARVEEVPIESAKRLATVRGSLEQLEAMADEAGDAWLRAIVAEPPRPGLAETVREILPGAIEVRIDERFLPEPRRAPARRQGRGPRGLFRDYLDAAGRAADDDLTALFDRLLDDETSAT